MRYLLAVALSLSSPLGAAAQGRDLAPLFPTEATVEVDGPGLTRLPLPVEVLRAARGDLADLRLFDDAATPPREVPFLIDSGARPVEPARSAMEVIDGEVLSVSVSPTARVGLPPLARETFIVAAPDHAPPEGGWSLVVVTARPRFVRRVEVRQDGGTSPLLGSGAVFRLPSPPQERLRVRLPGVLPRTVRVDLEGDAPNLEPAFWFEAARRSEAVQTFEVPLAELSRRRSEDDRTTLVEVARPHGIVPSQLRIDTDTRTFDRPVSVRDRGRDGGDHLLARGTLLRVADLGVDLRVVDLPDPRGDRLLIAIEDGDSPPLDGLRITAIVERPALVFDASAAHRAAAGATGLVLRFGGGRARAPGYDLSRLAGTEIGRRLLVDGVTGEATMGAPRPNPRYDPRPALELAMRPGASVDPRAFAHTRALRVESAPEGSSRFRLGAEDLAAAQPDLADLRLVDARGAQWPYLIAREGIEVEVPLHLPRPSRQGRRSRHALSFEHTPVTAGALLVDPTPAYVDRAYRVIGRVELPVDRRARARPGDDQVILAEGRLVRRPGETGPIRLPLVARRVAGMTLEIDDGDDAPLSFEAASAVVPSADLHLVAPPGDYRLLVGNPGAPPAHYEIERARELVLAVHAEPMAVRGPLEPSPGFIPPGTHGWSTTLLWLAILLAVLVLGFLTLRLARREEPEPEPPPTAAPPTEGA